MCKSVIHENLNSSIRYRPYHMDHMIWSTALIFRQHWPIIDAFEKILVEIWNFHDSISMLNWAHHWSKTILESGIKIFKRIDERRWTKLSCERNSRNHWIKPSVPNQCLGFQPHCCIRKLLKCLKLKSEKTLSENKCSKSILSMTSWSPITNFSRIAVSILAYKIFTGFSRKTDIWRPLIKI